MKTIFLITITLLSISISTTIAQTNVPAGLVSGVWTTSGSPYNIQGSIQISNDSTLIIQPGVNVVFQGAFKLTIKGRLLAIGTVTDSISFTTSDIINGWRGIRFENTATTNDSSKFKFCKFKYGKAVGSSPNDYGGALYLTNFSKVSILNCSILNCTANNGAGIYCNSSSPVISNNIISNNIASSSGGGIYSKDGSPNIINNTIINNNAVLIGGGIYAILGNANIANNTISQNSTGSSSGAGGGGIYSGGGSPNISNNTIINNNSSANGGGIYCQSGNISNNTISNNSASISGGGVTLNSISTPYLSFTKNIISNNTAVNGGGINYYLPFGTFSDNIICNNTATANGGGFYCSYNNRSNIINATITNNRAANGGAVYCIDATSLNFRNCIINGNTASVSGQQLFITSDTSQPNFYFCNVQAGSSAFEIGGYPYIGIYQKNIDANPLFIAASGGSGIGFNGLTANWSLTSSSPCIDKGDSNETYPATEMTGKSILKTYNTTDIAGKPRVNVCRRDIGAYEYQSGIPLAISLNIVQPVLCNATATGQISAIASGGLAPYKYSWSNGDTSKNVSRLVAGTYSVKVTETGTGCVLIKSITLEQPLADSVHAGSDKSIICGNSAQLFASPKWAILNSGTTVNLNSIFFTDINTGYIVGNAGKILKTIDGGTNWTAQTSGTTYSLSSVYFTDNYTGYAVGATILKTTNGGINWTTQTSGTTAWLNSVYFTDANTGYAVGDNGTIIKTVNGGTNWTVQNSGTTAWLSSVYFTDAKTGYAVGYIGYSFSIGTILKTIDGGATWTNQNCGSSKYLWSVYFINANTGYAVGENGTILKTTNGGTNWFLQTSGTTNWLYSIYFTDVNTGYAVGSNSTVLRTTDGGANWLAQTSGKNAEITSVFITKANIAFAVGYSGTILTLAIKTISYSWYPSSGLNAINISNPIANPNENKKYIVTATTTNGCIAKDSVSVYINALTADAGMDKSIICGGTAQLDSLISNYNGPLTYSWSPAIGLNFNSLANPMATITSDTTYFVSITTANGCNAIDSVKVMVNPLTISGTDGTIICGDSTMLSTTTNYTGKQNLNYLWSPNTGLSNSTVANPIVKISSDKFYTVTISTANGCSAKDELTVKMIPMNAAEICIVGVSSNKKNMVVWNKPVSTVIDSYYIYRETNMTGVYQFAGAVNYDSLSVFVDSSSNPAVQSNKYRITIKDRCGLESLPGAAHKTMHLAINQGMGSSWNLIWDSYQGFMVTTYNIYRGSTANNMQMIGTSSASNTQYTDLTPPTGIIYYQVEVISPNSCNPTRSYNSSLSNISTNNPDGIYENKNNLFSVSPNPSNANITIELLSLNNDEALSILDMQGQILHHQVLKTIKSEINTSSFSKGVYFIELKTKKGIEVKKFIKQ